MIDYKRFLSTAAISHGLRGYAASVGEISRYIANNGAWATDAEIDLMVRTLVERGEMICAFGERYVVHHAHREEALKGYVHKPEHRDHIDQNTQHLIQTKEEKDRLAAEYHARVAARKKNGDGTLDNPITSRQCDNNG